MELPKNTVSDRDRFIAVVNNLLAEERLKAKDHDYDLGGEMFYGAALVKTKNGNYFVSPNIHVQNAKTTRNCAEANAITGAVQVEGTKRTEITDVWFMGGRADLDKAIKIVPRDSGRRYSPCGSCCDAIWNHGIKLPGNVTKETTVHMLPLNDGTWRLKQDDGRPQKELESNQIMSRKISELLPSEFHIADEAGKLKDSIRRGWEYINDRDTVRAMGAAVKNNALVALGNMKDKPAGEIVSAINKLMMESAKDLINNSVHPIRKIRIAVVRMDNGEYFMGTSTENGVAPASSNAEVQAIERAGEEWLRGHRLTDVFIMAIDAEQMPKLLKEFEHAPASHLDVHMPDGATRERISKNSPYERETVEDVFGNHIDHANGANVHIIMPNNITDFDPDQHVVTRSLQQLLPYRYSFPKMDKLLAGHGDSGSITLT